MRVIYHDPNIRDVDRRLGPPSRRSRGTPRSMLTLVVTCIGLLTSGAAQSSEFLRLCQASMAKAEAFLAECRTNARPFRRNFYPGGRGEPVPEEFWAWFDVSSPQDHFGLGCVLGRKKEDVRHLGLYFFLDKANFQGANSLPLGFIDWQGNVGLRSAQGKPFVLVAVHKLTAPGQRRHPNDQNCEVGQFDASAGLTVRRIGEWLDFFRILEGDPIKITKCLDREIRFQPSQCLERSYKSFLNKSASRVISAHNSLTIIVTEEARVFVHAPTLDVMCERDATPGLEYINFVKELCAHAHDGASTPNR